jgi:UDP-N-acetylmuramoylalanine--D-glutamate ligase
VTPLTALSGSRVAVFGLGGSGLATARALVAGGAVPVVWDDSAAKVEEARRLGIEARRLEEIDWAGITALVLSPGVPLTHPSPHPSVTLARSFGVPVIGDVELFARERRARAPDAPFLAITGTNGKSTTTALIAHLFAHAGRNVELGGNIGTAILSLEPPSPERVHVVECSSFQIDLAPSIDPSVGVLLNVTEDHLDRHGSIEAYAAIKERLAAGAATAVIAVDDPFTHEVADRLERAGRRVVRVSSHLPLAGGVYASGQDIVVAERGATRSVGTLAGIGSLRGEHNAQNACAAFAAARASGLNEEEILAGLRSFPGLAHRMEEVARRGGTLFVNDSKATNPAAAAKALAAFDEIYWIAGGRPKTGGISSLEPYFGKIRKAYLVGEAAPPFAAELDGKVDHVEAGTIERAVAMAAADAAVNGSGEAVVLLSPACASFDQFRNFEERGSAFKEAVASLPATG